MNTETEEFGNTAEAHRSHLGKKQWEWMPFKEKEPAVGTHGKG